MSESVAVENMLSGLGMRLKLSLWNICRRHGIDVESVEKNPDEGIKTVLARAPHLKAKELNLLGEVYDRLPKETRQAMMEGELAPFIDAVVTVVGEPDREVTIARLLAGIEVGGVRLPKSLREDFPARIKIDYVSESVNLEMGEEASIISRERLGDKTYAALVLGQ